MFAPKVKSDLGIFYFIWIGLFLLINIIWDISTKRTRKFHFTDIGKRKSIIHQASFFCSSLLLIIANFNHGVWVMTEESYIPILLAGFSGMFASLPAICPYKLDLKGQPINNTEEE